MPQANFSDDLLRVHLMRAAERLPGPYYYEALSWIHDAIRPCTYLEIGVREGDSLRVARSDTQCVGVDPAPELREAIAPNLRIFDLTSDCFFADVRLSDIWNSGYFDLAFIDGLHLFEQALRDFINLERYAAPGSVIMLHDCIPLDELTSSRVRTTHFYSGDTWKLIPVLIKWRPDLRIDIVAAPPTGLCLVSNCDSASRVLSSNYDEIVKTYVALGFESYLAFRSSFPEFVENTRQAVMNCVERLRCTTDGHTPPR